MVHDLRVLRRWAEGRNEPPAAASFDSRTLQSSPESGARAGYDGAQRRLGSKMYRAVDTLGNLLALPVTPASEQNRAQVSELAQHVQDVTHQSVKVAVVDQGYPGDKAEQAAAEQGIQLIGVKLPEAQTGLVLLPRRWLLEPSFGWLAGFRRLARDYERLLATLKRLHFLAFAVLMLAKFVHLMAFVLSFMTRSNTSLSSHEFKSVAADTKIRNWTLASNIVPKYPGRNLPFLARAARDRD